MKKLFTKILVCLAAATFVAPVVACGDDDSSTVRIFMPDGAPAVALSALMDGGYKDAEFTVVKAATISGRVSTGDADMAIMPVNAAAKLYNGGVKIVMLSVNTHGNLYIVGGESGGGLTALVGKKLGVIGKGQVPDMTLRMLLDKSEIEYTVSEDAAAGKIAIRYAGNGGEVMQMLGAGAIDFALLGEPAATNAVNKLNKSIVADMQAEWTEKFGGAYPQACLVAKKSLVKDRPEYVADFLTALKNSDGWAEENPDAALTAIKSNMEKGIVSELAALSAPIVERCNIRTVAAQDAREDCVAYFTQLTKLEVGSGLTALDKVPDADFYYKK